ncbi:MAG: multiheme c-type cytochrome [Isosphaeraceae bacterium]
MTNGPKRWKILALGMLAVAVVALGGLWWLVPRPSLYERAVEAYERRDWDNARIFALDDLKQPVHDRRSLRLVARCDAQLGGAASLSGFRAVEDDDWSSEDLILIGRRWTEQGRSVLGSAALDAATKLEPRNGEAASSLAAALEKLQSQPDLVRQSDRFRAVSDPRALAQLLAGILRHGPSPSGPGRFDPWVDKVLQRDRMTLSRLDPAGARKLIARFLLEDGHDQEARKLLTSHDDLKSDPEADWLLSRAFLDAGDLEAASQALERSKNYGSELPLTHEPSRHAGAKSCAECHGAIYRAQQSSRHALTISAGPALADVPLPSGPVVDPARSDVVHTFDRKGAEIKVAARVGNETVRAVIDYALGSGHHGITMVGRDEKGVYRSLRMSYYTNGRAWEITSGYDPHPEDPAEYIGKSLSVEGLRTCLDCHTTRFRSLEERTGPEALDRGIGCEKCHGPGARHLSAIEHGFPQLAIARPKAATPAQRMALCTPCHGADGIIPPSDPRFVRFQSTTLPFSKCYTETNGRLDCIACHSPHHDVETRPEHYEKRCLVCHATQPDPVDTSIRVEPTRATVCPVNSRSGCIQCHMPKSDNVIPFTAFTDHHIRVHRPAGARGTDR